MKKQETIEEMEKRDAAGYARIPSQASEFEEWNPNKYGMRMKGVIPKKQSSKQQQPAKERR